MVHKLQALRKTRNPDIGDEILRDKETSANLPTELSADILLLLERRTQIPSSSCSFSGILKKSSCKLLNYRTPTIKSFNAIGTAPVLPVSISCSESPKEVVIPSGDRQKEGTRRHKSILSSPYIDRSID
jgi:hypothetical protein